MTRYSRSYQKRSPVRASALLGTGAVVCLLLGVFAYSVYLFRKPASAVAQTNAAPVVPIVSSAVVTPRLDTTSKEAVLNDVAGGTGHGTATRGTKDGLYYHTVKVSLPPIDRQAFDYEGWLVRTVPFDYFSTGTMVTNSLGEFVLEWSGEKGKDYGDYTKVVITLEPKDGNPDPAQHIVEGIFGD